MAKMIPATLPLQTESKAERQLFSVLRDSLDDSFTVFHSFNLLTQNKQGKFIDGEIDYLIFSPSLGFLVLEVKGSHHAQNPKLTLRQARGLYQILPATLCTNTLVIAGV
ncbi:MAG: NERD domain-containing protein [Candidatus Thorarchaeota archaeon]|jgi:hypothetical protein